jgi:WD40 repeat protein
MTRRLLLLGGLWALGHPGLGPAIAAGDAPAGQPPRRPELWAIVVGIDRYTNPVLRDVGPAQRVREATKVRAWLRSQAEWPPGHVLYLADGGNPDPGRPDDPEANILPTRKNLDWAFQAWLMSRARPGDLVVFCFAGRARASLTPQGPTVEPQVDYFLLPIDAANVGATVAGWSLDRALDRFVLATEGRCQVVCWLATTVRDGPPAPAAGAAGNRPAGPGPTGRDWLLRLARWPGVTAWLASDQPRDNPARDPAVLFLPALLDAMGDRQRKKNLADCLSALQANSQLKLQGFMTMGGVPPRLTLWPGAFGQPERPAQPEVVLQAGHADKLTAIAASADGDRVFTASQDSLVRIWSLERRVLLRVLSGHEVGVSCLGLSRNGQWLVSGGGRGSSAVLAYDLNQDFARKPVPRQPHKAGVVQVVMLPDGVHFVSLDRDGRSFLWDLTASSLTAQPWLPDVECLQVACSGNEGSRVAALCGDATVRLFNNAGTDGVVLKPSHGQPTTVALTAAAGTELALGFGDGRVVVRNLESGRERPWRVAAVPVRQLVFSRLGYLAVGHEQGVRLLPIGADQAQAGLEEKDLIDEPASDLIFSPDGLNLGACTEKTGALHVWRIRGAEPPQRAPLDAMTGVRTLSFSGDGRRLIAGCSDGSVQTRALAAQDHDRDRPWRIPAHQGKVQQLSAGPDRRGLLAIDERSQAALWNLPDRTCRRLPGTWSSGVFLDDHRLVLTAAADAATAPGHLMVVDFRNGSTDPTFFQRSSATFRVPLATAFQSLILASDGSRIAATVNPSQVPLVCVWDATTGRLTHWIDQLEDPVRSLSLSSDARFLLTAGDAPEAKLWDLREGAGGLKAPVTFRDPMARNITVARIRPGSSGQIVTGHSDGRVNLWNRRAGQARQDKPDMELVQGVFAGAVRALAFTPDGRYLAAAGDGTTIWLGEMEPAPHRVREFDRYRPHHLEQVNTLITWPGGQPQGTSPILISGSDDTTLRFWDLEGRTHWGTFAAATAAADADADADEPPVPAPDAAGDLDWVLYTPDGHYDGSPGGQKLVRFRRRDEARTFEQFDGTELYTFALAEQLRQGKSPQPTRLDEPPPIAIEPPLRLDPSLRDTELTVVLGARGLRDVRLYHNDRPVPSGVEDAKQPLPERFAVRVRLTRGDNRFYSMASSDGCYDSRSAEVVVPYDGSMEPGQIHVVALGVGDYADEPQRLKYAERDAERISKVLHDRGIDVTGRAGIRQVLTNDQVNAENVTKIFSELRQRVESRPQDTVVVFLAGHTGVFDAGRFCLLLPPFPFARANPVGPASRAPEMDARLMMPYSVVASNLMRLSALNRLVIVDACQADAILEDPQVNAAQRWMEIGSRRARTAYLMAARRGEPALEVDPLGHGLLTYTILRGMDAVDLRSQPEEIAQLGLPANADSNGDGTLTTGELSDYVTQFLPRITEQFPKVVTRGRAAVLGKEPKPEKKLDQRLRLRGTSNSFPLVPLTRPATR